MASNLFAEISSLDAEAEQIETTAAEHAKRLQAEDRSKIAKLVVWLFLVVCVGAALLFFAAAMFELKNWSGAGEMLLQLLSSVILPVVTLVIGYYFGSEQR